MIQIEVIESKGRLLTILEAGTPWVLRTYSIEHVKTAENLLTENIGDTETAKMFRLLTGEDIKHFAIGRTIFGSTYVVDLKRKYARELLLAHETKK